MKFVPLYRNELQQLSGDLFLTDGGLETTLIFQEDIRHVKEICEVFVNEIIQK